MTKKQSATVIIKVDGMAYYLDAADLTPRETGVLKRVGHIGGIAELPAALKSGDLEVVAALAGIAMARAGHEPNYERLLDLPLGMFDIEFPEGDEAPLSTTPEAPGTLSSPESMV